MSSTVFLEKLLDGADVEWRPLGEILNRTKGTNITAGEMKNLHKDGAPIKIFAGGKTFAFVNFNDVPLKDINQEPSIIVKSRGIIEFEYYSNPFTHKNEMWSYYSNDEWINIKYVFYFLKMNESHFQNLGKNRQMPQIAIPDTDKFPIPIPFLDNPEKSLAIQGEIVRILDTFTELTAELTAELTDRKKQYEYYREKLLTFDDADVEWRPLGEILNRTKGTNITAGEMKNLHKDGAPIKIFAGGKTFAFVNFNDVPLKDINQEPSIIVKSRGIIEFEYYSNPFTHKNEMWSYYSNDEWINIKYVFYFLKMNESHFQNLGKNRQMPQIAIPDTDKFPIPIPFLDNPEKSLAEQQRIVSILDKFDALTTSLTEGLPREIELRQKQYEYYRDLLLNFPKPEKDAA